MKSLSLAGAAFLASTIATDAHAQERIGQVLFALGEVERIAPDGTSAALARGDAILEGDVVHAGAQSHAQLLMVDEAYIALRPSSRLRFAAYRYGERKEGREGATLELLKGALRSITGAIGRAHKPSYRIETQSHILGVRGTDHETSVVLAGEDAGVYNHVIEGGTYLESRRGRLDLDAGQTGYSPLDAGTGPLRLASMPEFLHAAFAAPAVNSGPVVRASSPGDSGRLERALPGPALGVLPPAPRGLGRGASAPGIGAGGCGGPCAALPGQGRGRAPR